MSQVRIRTVVCGLVLAGLSSSACSGAEVADISLGVPEAAGLSLARTDEGDPTFRVVTPAEGSTVMSPVRIEIEVDNFALAPKGVSRDREGHFHVIVDGPCLEPGDVLGADEVHVGSGAAWVELELPPGTHNLCIQLGDGFHTALAITDTLTITVGRPAGGTNAPIIPPQ